MGKWGFCLHIQNLWLVNRYDFFVSYHWASGGTYAVNLAARLREKGYEVFLDRAEYAMGDAWKRVGEVALYNTQRLVLIATREAVFESKPVEHEIVKFTDRGRNCIPIFFGDSFAAARLVTQRKCIVLDRLPEDTLHIEDTIENLPIGPATEVVNKLVSAHGIMRRRRLRQNITLIALSLLTTLFLAATTFAILATIANNTAQRTIAEISLQNGNRAINTDGNIELGLLWYAKTLQCSGSSASTARRTARSLIGGWSGSLPKRSLIHDDAAEAVSFSPDGSTVATADAEGWVRMWNAYTGQPNDVRFKHAGPVIAMSFGPDSRILATVSNDGTVQLWSAVTGEACGETLMHNDGRIRAVSFSPDGRMIATGGTFKFGFTEARLWGVSKGEVRRWKDSRGEKQHGESLQHDGNCRAVLFSPDGRSFVTTSQNSQTELSEVHIWDANTGNLRWKQVSLPHSVFAVSFSPDSRTLATVGSKLFAESSEVGLWDAQTGQLRGEPRQLDGRVMKASFSPDSKILATVTDRNEVRLWDTLNGKLCRTPLLHNTTVNMVSFSPDSQTLATACADRVVRLWDAQMNSTRGGPLSHPGSLVAASFSPDCQKLVTASWDVLTERSEVRLWEVATRKWRELPLEIDGRVAAISFSPDGTLIAMATDNNRGMVMSGAGKIIEKSRGEALLWNVQKEQEQGKRMRHFSAVNGLSFSPDGQTLATASAGTAQLWNVQTGIEQLDPLFHKGGVTNVSFSPDGSMLATASGIERDHAIQLRYADSGLERCAPLKHIAAITAVSFSPDGLTLATANEDGKVQLWDVRTGLTQGEPFGNGRIANAISFSPDGRMLATKDGDEVWLFDIQTRLPRQQPLVKNGSVKALSFSPDGRQVVIASTDMVSLWDVPPQSVEYADRVALSIEMRSGHTIDDTSGFRALTFGEWRWRREQLDAMGGDCLHRKWDDVANDE